MCCTMWICSRNKLDGTILASCVKQYNARHDQSTNLAILNRLKSLLIVYLSQLFSDYKITNRHIQVSTRQILLSNIKKPKKLYHIYYWGGDSQQTYWRILPSLMQSRRITGSVFPLLRLAIPLFAGAFPFSNKISFNCFKHFLPFSFFHKNTATYWYWNIMFCKLHWTLPNGRN